MENAVEEQTDNGMVTDQSRHDLGRSTDDSLPHRTRN